MGAVRNADAQVRAAKGACLPSVTGATVVRRRDRIYRKDQPGVEIRGTGELVGGNTSSQNRQLRPQTRTSALFTGFRRGGTIDSAEATRGPRCGGRDLIDAQLPGEPLRGAHSSSPTLACRQLVRVREASVRRAEEQLKLAIAKLNAGSATRSDSTAIDRDTG